MLNKKVAVYVPSTVNGNQAAPAELIAKWLHAVKKAMASQFGGFTVLPTQGGWWSDTHGLIEENVTIIQSFTDLEGLANVGKINDLAKLMAIDMGQEAVSVEVDGVLNFITV